MTREDNEGLFNAWSCVGFPAEGHIKTSHHRRESLWWLSFRAVLKLGPNASFDWKGWEIRGRKRRDGEKENILGPPTKHQTLVLIQQDRLAKHLRFTQTHCLDWKHGGNLNRKNWLRELSAVNFIEPQTECWDRLSCPGLYKSLSTDCIQSEACLLCIISLATGCYSSSVMHAEWIPLIWPEQMRFQARVGQ